MKGSDILVVICEVITVGKSERKSVKYIAPPFKYFG